MDKDTMPPYLSLLLINVIRSDLWFEVFIYSDAQKYAEKAIFSTKVDKSTAKKNKASSKDSGAPKCPPSAFFVAKQGGVKWKSMSETEKAPYVAIAEAKKAEYGIAMKQHKDDLIEKEKSASTSKSSSETNDDGEQEATS
ncbi:hypothetical protein L1987_49464 [Smallanthus sonchifolius]|uniref:Uncharacterized protein n=1 Tax=Smallanthus sonchifolius TaxID=185202 RepID=A0ACB9FVQ0_9ASTR|nr:hypothetical protein L1987_49464 [Smallanthus sonchifolius]